MDQSVVPRIAESDDHPRGGVSKATLRTRMRVTLAFLDIFAIVCSFAMVSILHLGRRNHPGTAREQLLILIPVFLFIATLTRCYSPLLIQDRWASIGRSLRALVLSCGAMALIAFFARLGDHWSRVGFVIHAVFAGALLAGLRNSFGQHARFLIGGEPYEVFVIDDALGQAVPAHPTTTAFLQEEFDPTQLSAASYDRFAQAIEHADRIVVRCAPERRVYWTHALKGADLQGELLAPELAELNTLDCSFHLGVPTLVVSRAPLGLRHRVLKRTFDLAIAGTALLVLAPVMLVAALIIRLQDGGPVFFRQVRVGKSNRQFKIFKFRSMSVAGSDQAGNRSASRTDDRITRFGRIIRATSIDELPQLLNVLAGDMSIVGPRPHALGSTAEDLLFWDIDERYWQRHVMKPGLTGLAQVRGYRGATLCKEDLLNRLHSDLEYLRDWNLWRDVVIVLRTLSVVFHKNAY